MANKFHVNPETGNAGPCSAEKCPFGEDTPHGDSPADAMKAYEAYVANDDDPETNVFNTLKKPAKKPRKKKATNGLSEADVKKIMEDGERWAARRKSYAYASDVKEFLKDPIVQKAVVDYKNNLYGKGASAYLETTLRVMSNLNMRDRLEGRKLGIHYAHNKETGKASSLLAKHNRGIRERVEMNPLPEKSFGDKLGFSSKEEKEIRKAHAEFAESLAKAEAEGARYPMQRALTELNAYRNPNVSDEDRSSTDARSVIVAAYAGPKLLTGYSAKAMSQDYYDKAKELFPNAELYEDYIDPNKK